MVAAVVKQELDWDLQEALEQCGKGFSGKLYIRSSHGYEWCFHFFMGRIVGESSGVHAARRWQRLLAQGGDTTAQVVTKSIDFVEFLRDSSATLERMVKLGQITREQALSCSKTSILESLFDILHLQWLCHQSDRSRLSFQLVTETDAKKGVLPWLFFRTPEIYHEALTQFFTWQQNSLGRFSPNLAPMMKGLVPLDASTEQKSLLALVNGERTVRDLAAQRSQEPIAVMQALLPLMERGVVVLKAIPDSVSHKSESSKPTVKVAPKPLIAYVDDNPIEGKLMGSIVKELGCDYVSISDPLKALPELLKAKPQLIFLDLVMPIVNGYEVCTQLRRVALFSETPIVILTANDGIIDRVRAKVVGSTEFLSKPIDHVKIAQTLTKYNLISAVSTQSEQLASQLSY